MKAKTVKLGDFAKFLNGGTPSKEVSEYWSGTVPWISSADIVGFGSAHPTETIARSLSGAEGNNHKGTKL